MRATFIGIGAQKCASTWLHEALGSHPEIAASAVKELDFFSYTYGRGFQWYETELGDAAGKRAVGEISPSYFHHPEAPARAFAYRDDLRIVVSLRDPIERAMSNHLHLIKLRFLTGPDQTFERGLENNPMYLHQSRYALHLGRWLATFPRAALHVVLQEDVRARPQEELARLFAFLGVADTARVAPRANANASAVARVEGVDNGLRFGGQLLRRAGLGTVVDAVKGNAVVQRLRARNRVDLRTLVPPPRAETLERLRAEFEPDVRFVRTLLQRDALPWKHFPAP
jgi:hypothetical protein